MIHPEEQIGLLRTMIRIRTFEEWVRDFFAAGRCALVGLPSAPVRLDADRRMGT